MRSTSHRRTASSCATPRSCWRNSWPMDCPTPGEHDRGLVVFGEMVSVLWNEGNRVGALALEHLWNEVLKQQAFQLHCAYPRTLFVGDEAGIFNICESHSQILGVPAQSDVV